MTLVHIDDQVSTLDLSEKPKLSQVIQKLVATLPPNRLVTEISLDGRQIRNVEEGTAQDLSLTEPAELSIRTVDREIWAATGLDIAISCVERVQQSLIYAADLFRREDKAKANQFFVQCIDGMERFFEAILITRSVLKLDFSRVSADGGTLAQVEQNFSKILENIYLFQQEQDFPAIADKVEYELLTNLCAWTAALKQIRNSRSSNA